MLWVLPISLFSCPLPNSKNLEKPTLLWSFSLVKPKFHYVNFHRNFSMGKVAYTNHESSRHKSCRRFHDLCPRCRRLFQCIVTGQISLERHKRVCRKHLDMSRWLVSATFPAEKFRWKSAYWNFGVNSYSTVSRRYDAVLHIDRPAERLLGHQAGRAAAWIKDIRITVRFGDSNRQQNDTDHDDDDDATSFAAAAAADFHRSYSDWRNRKTQSSISAKVL